MEAEQLNIFDEQYNHIGVATRAEVHRLGHWHEAIHCWFVSREDGIDYIYLQLRSATKKDYPNLLDITAAGHLLAHEKVADGVREIEEEIGITVSYDDLVPLGVLKYCVTKENLIDKELANVFLYHCKHTFEDFNLQAEEVAGMVRAPFTSFYELWLGEKDEVRVEGFEINSTGEKVAIDKTVRKNSFVPHEDSYYESVLKLIKAIY